MESEHRREGVRRLVGLCVPYQAFICMTAGICIYSLLIAGSGALFTVYNYILESPLDECNTLGLSTT